ncbi:MAG: zinc-binding alcohol dehydrogenase [candidate division NC10 bacterium]|nr:zinc-binding alcohol dehydrogenase [candidate division NC10 bacterium]
MRATRLLFPEINRTAWEEFEIPETPAAHSVVARSICSLVSPGTELAIYTGAHMGFSLPEPPFPLIPHRPGYALVGVVEALGSAVQGLEVGQRVLMEAGHGTMAVADTRTHAVVPVPAGVSSVHAPLARMAGIAFTALRLAPPQLGDQVVVLGLGLVGLLTGQLFRLAGARPVLGADRLPSRLRLAEAFGIVSVDTSREELLPALRRALGSRGADIVVEATGSPALVPPALDSARPGGSVVLLGSTRGLVTLDAYSLLHRKAVRVIGGHETALPFDAGHAWPRLRNLGLALDLMAAGDLRTDGMITDDLTADQALTAHDMLRDHPEAHLGVMIHWR